VEHRLFPKGLRTERAQIEITARALYAGYITVEVNLGNGFEILDTAGFTTSLNIWSPVNLYRSMGFYTNPWRLRIFQGGSKTGDQWSGGRRGPRKMAR